MKQNTKDYIIKLFWIFIIASIIGCAVETIVCIVQKGHFEIRQGVIYGPFIPVYGAGAVLFYIFVPLITGATAENAKEISNIKIFLNNFDIYIRGDCSLSIISLEEKYVNKK